VLDDTLLGVLDRYPRLATVGVVPLGVSDHTTEPEMRPHTRSEAERVLDIVAEWQERFVRALGRRLVYAADEYFLLAGRPFPGLGAYDELAQHENGIGMAAQFAEEVRAELAGETVDALGTRTGFFAWVEGAPAEGYRAPRRTESATDSVRQGVSGGVPVSILTGEYGAQVLAPVADDLAAAAGAPVRIVAVANEFFGGNIAVTGLLTGPDVARALADAPGAQRFLLPDVVLSNGRFLDGTTPADLPRLVEIVATDGASLVRAVRR
jgi:NifB/MoaA-like Fe-S oxidoreductase